MSKWIVAQTYVTGLYAPHATRVKEFSTREEAKQFYDVWSEDAENIYLAEVKETVGLQCLYH